MAVQRNPIKKMLGPGDPTELNAYLTGVGVSGDHARRAVEITRDLNPNNAVYEKPDLTALADLLDATISALGDTPGDIKGDRLRSLAEAIKSAEVDHLYEFRQLLANLSPLLDPEKRAKARLTNVNANKAELDLQLNEALSALEIEARKRGYRILAQKENWDSRTIEVAGRASVAEQQRRLDNAIRGGRIDAARSHEKLVNATYSEMVYSRLLANPDVVMAARLTADAEAAKRLSEARERYKDARIREFLSRPEVVRAKQIAITFGALIILAGAIKFFLIVREGLNSFFNIDKTTSNTSQWIPDNTEQAFLDSDLRVSVNDRRFNAAVLIAASGSYSFLTQNLNSPVIDTKAAKGLATGGNVVQVNVTPSVGQTSPTSIPPIAL